MTGTAPSCRPSIPRRKKLVRRASSGNPQRLRRAFQGVFLALNLWIGVEFYWFVRYYETGGRTSFASRPPGVEGCVSAVIQTFASIAPSAPKPARR
ncbi:MAG TPA: hypothetical protein VKT49_04285, partial [Bryobacteraceae bacterium]|nr:hypothetical protein [Bryobacteraceae bacterium]